MENIPSFNAIRYNILIRSHNKLFKIFQVIFHTRQDKSSCAMLINFPYFSPSQGIISRITCPPASQLPRTISLEPEGKGTSHLIKYNHPLNGRAHFSASRIKPIYNQSKRLDTTHGHTFTLQIQGLDGFRVKEDVKKLNSQEIDLDFSHENVPLEAIKFIGRWTNKDDIRGVLNPGRPTPQYAIKNSNERGFILSPLDSFLIKNFVLLLGAVPIPKLDEKRDSVLSFIGGFDPINDPTKEFHALSCIYPTENHRDLITKIGTADI